MPNAGFLVGHSAHPPRGDGRGRRPSARPRPRSSSRCRRLLREGLAAGGLGFSSTWSTSHNDHTRPARAVAVRRAGTSCSRCARVVREFPGTTLEFIPQVGAVRRDDAIDLMAAMSRAANRPLNWNLHPGLRPEQGLRRSTSSPACDYAAEHGGTRGRPDPARQLPHAPQLRSPASCSTSSTAGTRSWPCPTTRSWPCCADPEGRAEMDRAGPVDRGPASARSRNWEAYVLVETFTDEYKRFMGRPIGEIAAELGKTPWDTLADIVVADELRTVDRQPRPGPGRRQLAAAGRGVAGRAAPSSGASDAGAHLDMIDRSRSPPR